jgi:ATP-dependent helicase/nuclease subunit B
MTEGSAPDVLTVVADDALGGADTNDAGVITWSGLKERLRAAFTPNDVVASPVELRLALAAVAADVASADPWLAPMARRGGRAFRGVVDAMDDALGALTGRHDALSRVARGQGEAAERARLLERISLAHQRALAAAGRCDPRRLAERLTASVARADAADVARVLSALRVRTVGVVLLSIDDARLLRALDASLSRLGGGVSVDLPVFERPLDAERERDPLDTVIDALAAALDSAPQTTAIIPVMGELGPGGSPSPSGSAEIVVLRPLDVAGQGRAIGRRVHAALERGVPPADILVALASDDDTAAVAIVRGLEEHGIRAHDRRRRRRHRSHLVATVFRALDVAARGLSRTDVALLLRSSYLDASRLTPGLDESAARALLADAARALEETETAAAADPVARLHATVLAAHALPSGRRDDAARLVVRVATPLARLAEAVTRPALVAALRQVIGEIGLSPGEPPTVDRPEAWDIENRAAWAHDADGWKALMSTLDEYDTALARWSLVVATASVEDLRHELAWALGRRDVASPPDASAVAIVRLADVASKGAKVLVIADAHADAWPEACPRSALIRPELDGAIQRALDPAFRPLGEVGPSMVLAATALAASTAHEVVVSYVAHGHDGDVRSPAPLVTWLRPRSGIPGEGTPLVRTTHDASTVRRATRERLREETFNLELGEDHPLTATLPLAAPYADALREETGGGARLVSASAIEDLASCVFRGFVTTVLRPRQGEVRRDAVDPRKTGQLLHRALEAAFLATKDLWTQRPRDAVAIRERAAAAASRVIGAAAVSSDPGGITADRLQRHVDAIIEWSLADEAWDFALAEQPFGEPGGWPAVVLERNGQRVAVRGRIDRVDVASGRHDVRVVDYKTRERAASTDTALLGDEKFQVALYARAAEVALGRSPAMGLYLSGERLRPGDLPAKADLRWQSAHERLGNERRFEEAILDVVQTLRQGELSVRPRRLASCGTCAYDGVCRKPRFAPPAATDDDAEDDP